MQFQVPQFIEVEDKIFGPLTIKQFIYVAGAVGFFVIMAVFMPLIFAILVSLPVAALGFGLAFLKINNQPFIRTLESALSYARRSKLYLWKKVERPAKAKAASRAETSYVPKLSDSKLKDLAWNLDIHEHTNAEHARETQKQKMDETMKREMLKQARHGR